MINGIITEFDSKEVTKVRMRFGAEGYLVYVAIQELLYRHINHALERNYDAIAAEICVDANLVKGVIEQLDLFVMTDTHFTSISINAYFESKRKLSESKARGGYARWGKKQKANAQNKEANAQQEQANVSINEANAYDDIANANSCEANAQQEQANAQSGKEKEAKRNNISNTKSYDFDLWGGCTREGEGRPTEKLKRRRKSDKDPEIVRLNSEARELFKRIYLEKYGSPYVWGAVDAGQMSNLLSYIRVSRAERKTPLPTDTDSMLQALETFLNAINDSWVLGNFSVKVIASKYNEIVSRIKGQKQISKANGTSNRQDSRSGTAAPELSNEEYRKGF